MPVCPGGLRDLVLRAAAGAAGGGRRPGPGGRASLNLCSVPNCLRFARGS